MPPAPHRTLFAAALLAATLLSAGSPARAVEADLLPVGSLAPAFESVDVDGKPFVLTEVLKTKRVLMVFWSISCASCRDEMPLLEQEMPKYGDKVQFVSVNIDDDLPRARVIAVIKGFMKQQNLTFPMLLNKSESKEYNIYQSYKVKYTPTLYLINQDGSIAFGHSSPVNPDELADILTKAQ